MSIPMFASAPRVKLHIGGSPLGYAIGFNFNISVDVQPVYTIGQYNAVALEPTYYNAVTGTIQIIRLSQKEARVAALTAADLAKGAVNNLTGQGGSTVNAWDGKSSSVATVAGVSDTSGGVQSSSVLGTPGSLYTHLDPNQVLLSQLFDMDIYIRVQSGAGAVAAIAEVKNAAGVVTTAAKDAIASGLDFAGPKLWMQIKSCRITSRNTNITFGQIVNEPVSFNGLLALPDGCSFAADSFNKDVNS